MIRLVLEFTQAENGFITKHFLDPKTKESCSHQEIIMGVVASNALADVLQSIDPREIDPVSEMVHYQNRIEEEGSWMKVLERKMFDAEDNS